MGTALQSRQATALIPTVRLDVFEAGMAGLEAFGSRTNVRGRFVALYLGLRRMGTGIASMGSTATTPTATIEHFLDEMFTKTHRTEPVVVLTAPFGGSTSSAGGFSARTGVTAPGNRYPTNTWRNNFGIQKGIGCPAEAATVSDLLQDPGLRLACPHMALDPDERYTCTLANTAYRGDEHSIWLRISDGGYQVVDLDLPAVYGSYLVSSGLRIPVFPLIAVLYGLSPTGVYPARPTVGIPEFAADFRFTLELVDSLFDCDPDSSSNADVLAVALGQMTAAEVVEHGPGVAEPPMPTMGPVTALNTGVGAEIIVADELVDQGWSAVYRGNQRGFGYDIEATRDGQTLRVEVKSSVGFTVPELTESEWNAAQVHGDDFVLAVVDFYGSGNHRIWYLRNPAANAIPAERSTMIYRLSLGDIRPLGTDVEFL